MSANVGLLAERPVLVIGIAAALIAAKTLIVYVIALVAGAGNDSAQRLAVVLSAGGEFAFVIFGLAGGLGIIAQDLAEALVLAVTLSMLAAPLFIAVHEKLLDRVQALRAPPEFDTINEPGNAVVIAGFGRFGQIVSRVLRMCGIPFTALDASSEQVDFVRRFGNKIYYGDASRLELLHAAKVEHAKVFVLAIDDIESSVRTAALVRKHFPQLPILARARNRVHYFRLRELGIGAIHRETFPASLDVARQALLRLGFGVAAAEHAVALFKTHDEEQLAVQGAVQHDEAQLIELAKHATDQLRELFEADAARPLAGFPQRAALPVETSHPG
jgi:glutathione-regulated potassium-efflux system ancillary protein KefC/glutathione-regulated potassium-efflux system protein KefB